MAGASSSPERRSSVITLFDEKWRRYDKWYEEHQAIYETELAVVREALSGAKPGWSGEIGVGTGRFAAALGVWLGIDPSINMLRVAKRRGVEAIAGVAEALPVRDAALDTALLIVTLCFVDDPLAALREAGRVARRVVACIVPRESPWGRFYSAKRSTSPFYRYARFYTVRETVRMGREAGLRAEYCVSSLYTPPPGPRRPEEPRRECSEAAGFVCIVFGTGGREPPPNTDIYTIY